jgi:hypothetical protein
VEAEAWRVAPVAEDPAGEDDKEPEIDEAQPEDRGACTEHPRWLDLAVLPATTARRRRWHELWDEDVLWGDLDPESRRRLKRLLGGDLK